jgi:hypothetical protein
MRKRKWKYDYSYYNAMKNKVIRYKVATTSQLLLARLRMRKTKFVNKFISTYSISDDYLCDLRYKCKGYKEATVLKKKRKKLRGHKSKTSYFED